MSERERINVKNMNHIQDDACGGEVGKNEGSIPLIESETLVINGQDGGNGLGLTVPNLRKREGMEEGSLVEEETVEETEMSQLKRLVNEKVFKERKRWLKYQRKDGFSEFNLGFEELKEVLGMKKCQEDEVFTKAEKNVKETLYFDAGEMENFKSFFGQKKFKNKLVIGFSLKKLERTKNEVQVERLPKMAFEFNDIDYDKAIQENMKLLNSRATANKRNTINEVKEKRYVPMRPKKGEIPLSLTARMIKFESDHKIVIKTECYNNLEEAIAMSFETKKKEHMDTLVDEAKLEREAQRDREVDRKWKEVCSTLLNIKKYFGRSDTESNAKKVMNICMKERKKTLSKYRRIAVDYVLRAKKFIKEVQAFYKKKNKEIGELRKKRNKYVLEVQKKEEELREQEKQKKKIEFLIKQSSFYAEIMANKIGIRSTINNNHALTTLSKEEERKAMNNAQKVIASNQKRCNEYAVVQKKENGVETNKDTIKVDFSNVNIDKRSTLIDTPTNFKGTLKSYQLKGLRWLDSLFTQGINGILADEMGLGKTIQAIALLAHLSKNRQNWGPYLIIAPAIILFNWFSELERFAPELKVLPYWGSLKERKVLRRYFQHKLLGKQDSDFHVFVTSYQIAVSDEKVLHKLKWQYIILDEAQAIKNMNSLRWNTLLKIQSKNKLLLTGTPIQNTMAELWALLHFVMPTLFDSHEQFQEWFSKNIESQDKQKINQIQLNRLHAILKPFMLRRVKKDVEKEIGKKYEHQVFCELTRRQRELYGKIKRRLPIEGWLRLRENKDKVKNLMNLVMQFRKVCNHPELFERKLIKTNLLLCKQSFAPDRLYFSSTSKCKSVFLNNRSNLLNFTIGKNLAEFNRDSQRTKPYSNLLLELYKSIKDTLSISEIAYEFYTTYSESSLLEMICGFHYLNYRNKSRTDLASITGKKGLNELIDLSHLTSSYKKVSSIYLRKVIAQPIKMLTHLPESKIPNLIWKISPFKHFESQFPSVLSLINDSAKLRYLNKLLKGLKEKGKRALIFCQMTKMLDILEDYLQFKRHKYFRLDGSCMVSDRRDMVNEFQTNKEIFIFLLSTRAGGLGVTLTAADVVIFFDNDWNPTMDAQAADRAHRIGRTEDVHVYNLITKNTIEEKIILRAKQKKDVQKTLYSGDAFKANMFKPTDFVNLLFEDQEIQEVSITNPKNEKNRRKSSSMKLENGMSKTEQDSKDQKEPKEKIEKLQEDKIVNMKEQLRTN